MSDFKANCTKFDCGWAPPDYYGSLQPSPDTLTRFKRTTSVLLRGERGEKGREMGGERERGGLERREGKSASPFQIPGSATASNALRERRLVKPRYLVPPLPR